MDKVRIEIILAEYKKLNSETNQRSIHQMQLLYFSFLIMGALIGGWAATKELSLLLVSPLLTAFLVSVWKGHDRRIHQIGDYIGEHIEKQLPDLKWEHYLRIKRHKGKFEQFMYIFLSSRNIFLVVEVIPIIIALAVIIGKAKELNTINYALLSLAMIAITFTWLMLKYKFRQ